MQALERLQKIIDAGPAWRDRGARKPVGPERWGRDHISVLVLIECRAVDNHGRIDWNHLTISRRNWPMLWMNRSATCRPAEDHADAADKYGLRLRPGTGVGAQKKAPVLLGHCEADAIMDLVDAGLVTITMPPVSQDGEHYLKPNGMVLADPVPAEFPTGRVEWDLMPWARFGLTDLGWTLAHRARRHRVEGGGLGLVDLSPLGAPAGAR